MQDAEKQDGSFYWPPVNACYDYGASRIKWRRIANVNKTTKLCLWCVKAPTNFKLALSSRWAILSDNTSLITFSRNIHIGTVFQQEALLLQRNRATRYVS